MCEIVLLSTIHEEIGKCNADELFKIIEKLNPDVIFLEALDKTYSDYQKMLFNDFGIEHKKLEIKAIQMLSKINISFKYIPVLNYGLSNSFELKYNLICKNDKFQDLLNNYNKLVSCYGFEFINSEESIKLQDELRLFENNLLEGKGIIEIFNKNIDEYENNMIKNINNYSTENRFEKAIFICGVAHRKSIIEKITKTIEGKNLKWLNY